MKDYMVKSATAGTRYYTPRIVRAESAQEALWAVLTDHNTYRVEDGEEYIKTRKLPNQNIFRAIFMIESHWSPGKREERWDSFEVEEWAEVSDRYRGRFYRLNPQEFIRLDRHGNFVRRWSTGDAA